MPHRFAHAGRSRSAASGEGEGLWHGATRAPRDRLPAGCRAKKEPLGARRLDGKRFGLAPPTCLDERGALGCPAGIVDTSEAVACVVASTAHAGVEFVGFAEAHPVVASGLKPLIRVNDDRLRCL